MKPFKRIALLSGIVSGIVLLWLMPNINTAKQSRYVRTWENTDAIKVAAETIDTTRRRVVQPEVVKAYKTEVIDDEAKLSEIEPEMFSRAIHFEQILEEEIPLVLEDSSFNSLETDSMVVARIDSLSTTR